MNVKGWNEIRNARQIELEYRVCNLRFLLFVHVSESKTVWFLHHGMDLLTWYGRLNYKKIVLVQKLPARRIPS